LVVVHPQCTNIPHSYCLFVAFVVLTQVSNKTKREGWNEGQTDRQIEQQASEKGREHVFIAQ
jgi:hypothetical protein